MDKSKGSNLEAAVEAEAEAEAQDEINEIMQEIEDLQEGIAQTTKSSPESQNPVYKTPPPITTPEVIRNHEDPVMEETLEDLKIDSDVNNTEEANEGSLSLTLTGNMTLRLKYEYEGQEVTIGFRDQSLQVELSDGTEFKIPVRRVPLKAVA